MVTTVGSEDTTEKLVKNLLYLEHDAIAAYESTIHRLTDAQMRDQLEEFREDHLDHVAQLERFATELGIDAPTEGDSKEMLTTGKVAMASLAGDQAIISAMKTNEDDTVGAYEKAKDNAAASSEMGPVFAKALEDEKRHRAWMENASSS